MAWQDRRMRSPSHPQQLQHRRTPSGPYQLAGDTCSGPALPMHRRRPRDRKGCIVLTQPVWGEDGNSNSALLVANLWLVPLHLSTPWFEARLSIPGDLL